MDFNPVLLVVDMQNAFCKHNGSLDKFGIDIKSYKKIIPNLIRMIGYMRGLRTPICYSQAIKESSGVDLLDRRVLKTFPENNEKMDEMDICVKDTWDADIIEEVYPLESDTLVQKKRNSVFQDTDIDQWLKQCGADTIILTGNDLYTCVESSARDAYNRGYKVITLSDCVTSREEHQHVNYLLEIADAYGWVLTSTDMINKIYINQTSSGLKSPSISLTSLEHSA